VQHRQSHLVPCWNRSKAGLRYTAMSVPQFAYQRGAEALPRAWSRYTPGTTANAQQAARQHPAADAASQPRKDKKQPKTKQREAGDAQAVCCWRFDEVLWTFVPKQVCAAQLHTGACTCGANIRALSSPQARTMSSCRSFSRSCSQGGRRPSGPTIWRQQPAAGPEHSHSRCNDDADGAGPSPLDRIAVPP
jgi:hypothetical protein